MLSLILSIFTLLAGLICQVQSTSSSSFSAYGTFSIPNYHKLNTENNSLCVSSRWFQDSENEKLRLDVGLPGEDGFSSMFFFDHSGVVQVIPHEDAMNKTKTLECVKHSKTYQQEMESYSTKNFDFIGKLKTENRKDNVSLYGGSVGDNANHIHVLLYEEEVDDQYYYKGLDTFLQPSVGGFSKYWYYEHNMTNPDPEIFNWMKYCKKPIKEALEYVKNEPGSNSLTKYCNQ